MFYVAVDRPLEDILRRLEIIFKENNIEILLKEEKDSNTFPAKATVLSGKYKDKVFKISIVSWKDKITVSLVFPKKTFSQEEKEFLKTILEKIKDENN